MSGRALRNARAMPTPSAAETGRAGPCAMAAKLPLAWLPPTKRAMRNGPLAITSSASFSTASPSRRSVTMTASACVSLTHARTQTGCWQGPWTLPRQKASYSASAASSACATSIRRVPSMNLAPLSRRAAGRGVDAAPMSTIPKSFRSKDARTRGGGPPVPVDGPAEPSGKK